MKRDDEKIPRINNKNPMSSKGQVQIIPNPNVTTVKKNPTIMSSNPRIIDEKFIRVQKVKTGFPLRMLVGSMKKTYFMNL